MRHRCCHLRRRTQASDEIREGIMASETNYDSMSGWLLARVWSTGEGREGRGDLGEGPKRERELALHGPRRRRG
jgi:hypothetical protein